MSRRKHQPAVASKPQLKWLDNLLFCIVLGLTVLRITVIEAPHVDQMQTRLFLSAENISLLLSTISLSCVLLWFLVAVLKGRLYWRRTWFGVGMAVFVLAGILAAVFASNKRAAVTDLVILAVPMMSAVMLVQWLRSASAIRYTLFLILAVGAAATIQCVDQKNQSNEMVVAEYEADQAQHLQTLGIEPNSMEHWMYEHRLYSKDIRGFLMTSNSAATFFLMAFLRPWDYACN